MDNLFNNLISHISELFPDNKILENINLESNDLKINRIQKFNDTINTTTNFNYLLKNKIKLFSHKEKDTLLISESLFGSELSLKKIFNNQDDTVKLVLWKDLEQLLLAYNEYLVENGNNDKNILDKIEKLKSQNFPKIDPKESINKILNTDKLNSTTNNMINDIFSSFEKSMNNSNPFGNIMEIGEIITEKYKDEIEKGEINLDDLLGNMSQLPGMENMGNMVESLTKQFTSSQPEEKEKVVIDENFSTSIVPQGENKDNEPGMNVASLLKTMNSFGAMGLGNPLLGGQEPDMNKLMSVFGKLGETNNSSDINNIFQNELGIDMNKFTEEMGKALKKN
jgi:hypothetical protein